MSSVSVSLREHQVVPIGPTENGLSFSPDEAEELSLVEERRPGFCVRGYASVRFGSHCGVLAVGGRTAEVLPKAGAGSLRDGRFSFLNLLAHAGLLPLTELESVGHGLSGSSLLDVFIRVFLESVRDVVRYGLVRSYSPAAEDLAVVRGKISLTRQFGALCNRPDRLACVFDEVRGDNAYNRQLKAALRAARVWMASDDVVRLWTEVIPAFEDVPDARPSDRELETLRRDRRLQRYRTALGWARIILALQSPSLRAGSFDAPGLLFDMNLLFQQAVGEVMRKSLQASAGLELRAQSHAVGFAQVVEKPIDAGYPIRPDFLLADAGKTVAIADAKWKLLKTDKRGRLVPDVSDLYQVHAYAAAYHCDEVALIYPWHAGLENSVETTRALPGPDESSPVVHVVCVDVCSERFELKRGGSRFATLVGASGS